VAPPLLLLPLLVPLLLQAPAATAAAAASAAAAKSPDTLGGSGASGSANGVQSGGPASKGEDLARCRLQAEPPLRATPPLLGDVLRLDVLLSQRLATDMFGAEGGRGMGGRTQQACSPSRLAEQPGSVGTTAPGKAAAAAASASVLLLVARVQVAARGLLMLSVK
jgi:hypothetical protein